MICNAVEIGLNKDCRRKQIVAKLGNTLFSRLIPMRQWIDVFDVALLAHSKRHDGRFGILPCNVPLTRG
jgi:hypothetical protein